MDTKITWVRDNEGKLNKIWENMKSLHFIILNELAYYEFNTIVLWTGWFLQNIYSWMGKTQLDEGCKKRRRAPSLSPSEIITLIVFYHSSGYRTFKWFYTRSQQLSQAFPKLVSYNRFIELLPDILIPLTFFMKSRCATGNGIAFIDSTPLRVCNNLRISRHKTFKNDA